MCWSQKGKRREAPSLGIFLAHPPRWEYTKEAGKETYIP